MPSSLQATISRTTVRVRVIIAIVAIVLGGYGSAALGAQMEATPATPTGVVREVLSSGDPAVAPGHALELVRYTIPAGTQLVAHTHPGMQVASIVSGTLSYTVISGQVPVTRAATGEVVAVTSASGEVAIQPGDAFYEAEGVVHFGRNAGSEPVVILVSSLFTIGQPPSSPIDATPLATPRT